MITHSITIESLPNDDTDATAFEMAEFDRHKITDRRWRSSSSNVDAKTTPLLIGKEQIDRNHGVRLQGSPSDTGL